jgi:hypothetical protein
MLSPWPFQVQNKNLLLLQPLIITYQTHTNVNMKMIKWHLTFQILQ